jgi:hypothetical protein
MADLSFTFNPSDINSKATAASDTASKASVAAAKGSDASSKILLKSATWDKASAASSLAAANSDAASNALSKITAGSATWDKASAASSAVAALDAEVIKSVPGVGSFAVHEILYTAASSIKYVRSSVAA